MKTYGVALGPIERQIIADVEEVNVVSSVALARYQWLGDFLKRVAEWKRTKNDQ
jgi:hypothetical protein